MSQQFTAVVIDVASTVGTTQYSEVVKCATYSNAVMQIFSLDTGTAAIQVTSVDNPNVAGTPDNSTWYAATGTIAVDGYWAESPISPICAKYLRIVYLGAIGDTVKAVLTLQG